MHSYRFVFSLPGNQLPSDGIIELDSNESNHLNSVLRLKVKDCVEARNLEDGSGYICEVIENAKNRKSKLKIINKLPDNRSKVSVHIVCSVVKPLTADYIIEKCTEIGVKSITFIESNYSKMEYIQAINSRMERFIRTRNSALKQCGSSTITQIQPITNLTNFLNNKINSSINLFCASEFECHEVKSLKPRSIFEIFPKYYNEIQKTALMVDIYCVIGPEAGLAEEEVKLLIDNNFTPISLVKNVLRADTATILTAGILCSLGE